MKEAAVLVEQGGPFESPYLACHEAAEMAVLSVIRGRVLVHCVHMTT